MGAQCSMMRAARARGAARAALPHWRRLRQAAPAMEKASGTVFFEKPCSGDGHGQSKLLHSCFGRRRGKES
jgi:hypothetical protein